MARRPTDDGRVSGGTPDPARPGSISPDRTGEETSGGRAGTTGVGTTAVDHAGSTELNPRMAGDAVRPMEATPRSDPTKRRVDPAHRQGMLEDAGATQLGGADDISGTPD